ncbi:hypothetical protein [Lusitaniella coriacea]|uniref:hypothetical protein n=1 Tax=Lusitaniella coriacea TaxID=1983105 RepID=UPI003CF9A0C7
MMKLFKKLFGIKCSALKENDKSESNKSEVQLVEIGEVVANTATENNEKEVESFYKRKELANNHT